MAGTVFHDSKQILGRNGKNCEYLQVTGTANGILTVSCSFNETLSRDLYNALLLKPDYRAGINKTEEIWQKAMQNPKNCTYKRSEYYSKGFQIDPAYLPVFTTSTDAIHFPFLYFTVGLVKVNSVYDKPKPNG